MRHRESTVLLIVLLVVLLGCSEDSGQATRTSAISVAELEQRESQTAEVITDSIVEQAGAWFCASGGDAYWKWEDAALQSGEQAGYAVYQAGKLVAGDKLLSVNLELIRLVDHLDDARDNSCSVAIADFDSEDWIPLGHAVDRIAEENHEDVDGNSAADSGRAKPSLGQVVSTVLSLPPSVQAISDSGYAYLLVEVDPGSDVRVHRIGFTLDLAVGDFFQYRTDMPSVEACGYPLGFHVFACDQHGRVLPDYHGECELNCGNQALTLLDSTAFLEGTASFQVQLAKTGEYQVSLTGEDGFTQQLGSIEAYQTKLPVYQLYLSDQKWAHLQAHPFDEKYYKADFVIRGQEFNKAKVRLRGRNSRRLAKKSWKVKLDKDTQYLDPDWGYERQIINLNPVATDPLMLREKLAYDLMLKLGVLTPRARCVHLRINDRFAGLYTEVENPRSKWLAAFGVDNRGDLYKAEFKAAIFPRASADEFRGDFEKKLGDENSYQGLADLAHALDELNRDNQTAIEMGLGRWIELDGFTNYLVGLRLCSASDNYLHNYYLYWDRFDTGKWSMIPWDLDFSWGLCNRYDYVDGNKVPRITAEQSLVFACHNSLITILYFNSAGMRQQFKDKLNQALTQQFSEEAAFALIDEQVDNVLEDALADPYQILDKDEYLIAVAELKQYVSDRRAFLQAQLASF